MEKFGAQTRRGQSSSVVTMLAGQLTWNEAYLGNGGGLYITNGATLVGTQLDNNVARGLAQVDCLVHAR